MKKVIKIMTIVFAAIVVAGCKMPSMDVPQEELKSETVEVQTQPSVPKYIRVTEVVASASNFPSKSYAGATFKINASVLPADATNKTLTFTSDNPSVVTVDQNGNCVIKKVVKKTVVNITIQSADGPKKTAILTFK